MQRKTPVPTDSQPNASAAKAREQHALSGEIGMAIVWAVFYAIVLVAPFVSRSNALGTVVAFLFK